MQPMWRMTSVPATANEVRDVLGDIDDLVVERVLETGASVEEIASAMASLEYQQVLGERSGESVTGPTLTVRAILEELSPSQTPKMTSSRTRTRSSV